MDGGENMLDSWTRRAFLSASVGSAAALATLKLQAAPTGARNLVYVGSSTKKTGIYSGVWDAAGGTLSNFRLVFPADGAGFLVGSNRDGRRLLFAGHQTPPKVGALSGFEVAASGELRLINTVTVLDFDTVHTAIDDSGRCLVSASYGSGKVLSVKVAADGRLSEPVSQFVLTGKGPNADRQSSSHAHGVAFSPVSKTGKRFVMISDLGTDRIMVYKLNPATAELTANDPPYFSAAPGAGPRHLTFQPSGRWAYSVNELDSTVTQLGWDGEKGILTQIGSFPTLPAGGDVAANRAGEVEFDNAGKFLYSCNRGAPEELLVYAVGADGGLKLAFREPLGGKEARAFHLSPDEGYFLVAEQFSNRLAVFSRDRKTGELKPTSNSYPVENASCVVFV
jgi:6-phosphogluconolactonase